MMNYVAIQLVAYFVIVWEVPKGSGKVGIINQMSLDGWLPVIGGQRYLYLILMVAVITFAMAIYMKYTKHGYEIAVVGESHNTANYAGINVKKVVIRTMLISSGICGLAGAVIVSGASHTISTSTAGGRGFTAIIVAWMANLNPLGMLLVSAFLVFMQQGAIQIASQYGLNENASDIITGIIIFFLIGCEFFIKYRVRVEKKKEDAA
jgi:simple sugar transport system permease protein